MSIFFGLTPAFLALALPASSSGGDWPVWGRDETRNMVSEVSGLPSDFVAGDFVGMTDEIDLATTKNVKWIARLGSQSYGNPTVANGKVYLGTNNDFPHGDDRFEGDRSLLVCLDEQTGELAWQLNIPKLGTGKVSDWEFIGLCSSPAVEGDRVYFVTNRCEVMCVDANGMKDGNDGPFTEEAQYFAGPGKSPLEIKDTDADILWSLNMMEKCGVVPHNITSSSILITDDHLWASTSNGVDSSHAETPAPLAPCLILIDKKTGALLGREASGLSQRMFHCNWSSPAYLRTEEVELGIFGGPDGVLYAFEPTPVPVEGGAPVLQETWRHDCNPPEYREKDGEKIEYATARGPSEILGTPVVCDGLVYAVIGQDPEHGEGVGCLTCVDARGKKVWEYKKIRRSFSTLSIANGLLFAADYSGFVYCLDAKTGKEYWVHDTQAHIWGSTLVADGKVFVGNEDGYVTILPAKKKLNKDDVIEIEMPSPIYSSPIAANGVLYFASHTHLYAIADSSQ